MEAKTPLGRAYLLCLLRRRKLDEGKSRWPVGRACQPDLRHRAAVLEKRIQRVLVDALRDVERAQGTRWRSKKNEARLRQVVSRATLGCLTSPQRR